MRKGIVYFLLTIGILVIGSCSKVAENDVEKLPGIDVPINEMNSIIELEPNPGMPNVHKSGETLVFLIRNRSSKTITFSQDFGIKIFKKTGTIWESVENKWGYPEGGNILPTTAESPTGLGLFVFPVLKNLKESTNVRIVVIGHVKDKSDEQVGAYFDVFYEP